MTSAFDIFTVSDGLEDLKETEFIFHIQRMM